MLLSNRNTLMLYLVESITANYKAKKDFLVFCVLLMIILIQSYCSVAASPESQGSSDMCSVPGTSLAEAGH